MSLEKEEMESLGMDFIKAVENGDKERCEHLLHQGIDINYVNQVNIHQCYSQLEYVHFRSYVPFSVDVLHSTLLQKTGA